MYRLNRTRRIVEDENVSHPRRRNKTETYRSPLSRPAIEDYDDARPWTVVLKTRRPRRGQAWLRWQETPKAKRRKKKKVTIAKKSSSVDVDALVIMTRAELQTRLDRIMGKGAKAAALSRFDEDYS